MANRFTDSQKWDDPWFRKLPCKIKAFWIFLLDKCSHAGIWKVDFESVSFHIGEPITKEEALSYLNGRIHEFKDKWFVPKFIFFQYGVLSEANRVHNSVIEILKKEGLFKVYIRSVLGCKDYNKDKDKDKDKDKEGIVKGNQKKPKTLIPADFKVSDQVKAWAIENKHDRLEERLAHFIDWAKSGEQERADWDATLRNAIRGDWAKLNFKKKVEEKSLADKYPAL